jgi:hypothetical protein
MASHYVVCARANGCVGEHYSLHQDHRIAILDEEIVSLTALYLRHDREPTKDDTT